MNNNNNGNKMKNNTLTIMKKECARIISDRKLLFTAVLLPGILIYVMYTFMGNFMGGMFEVDDSYIYQVHVVNMPPSVYELMSPPELRLNIINVSEADAANIKQQIEDRETDLLVVFPLNFDYLVAAFDVATATGPAPNVQIWANVARNESSEARMIVDGLLNAYHHALTHRFSIESHNLATEADMLAMVLGFMIPMLFIMFIYQGCMAIAPDCISGEKERGTLGAILVTPASRRDMAFGKILSIAIFGLLSAVGSIVGTMLALPGLVGLEGGNIMDVYTPSDFLLLFVVAASTTLVFVSALSVMSAYAKSVKEANAYATPFMLISIVCGLASTVLGGVPEEIYFYLIPIFNSALSITSVINGDISAVNIIVTAATNIIFTLICTGVLARIFSSEKIVFDK